MAGLDDWDNLWLRNSVQELPPFTVSRASRVNDDVLSVSRRSPKEIEDCDPVISVCSDEWVIGDPNLMDFRDPRQSCEFGRIRHLVVTKVESLKGKQSLDAG